MIIELTGIVTPLIYELGKDLVKKKLLPKKDEAKKEMQIILFELKQIYLVFEKEFDKFRLLNFSNSNLLYYSNKDLASIINNNYKEKFNEARGHCDKIIAVYYQYLKRWFATLVSPKKAEKLDSLFTSMSNFDHEMLVHIENFVSWITKQAVEINKLVTEEKYQLAEEKIRKACDEFKPSMDHVRKLLKDISDLESQWS